MFPRLGRFWSNLLQSTYLSPQDGERFSSGRLSLGDLEVQCALTARGDLIGQMKQAAASGAEHVELDAQIPNAFFGLSRKSLAQARGFAREHGLSLSMRLPHTDVSGGICSLQEEDRQVAVAMHRRYLDVAERLECHAAVIRPGSLPRKKETPAARRMALAQLEKSLRVLALYALQKEMYLHVMDPPFGAEDPFEKEELSRLLDPLLKENLEVKYAVQIGNMITQGDGKSNRQSVPAALEALPPHYFWAVYAANRNRSLEEVPIPDGEGRIKEEDWKEILAVLIRKEAQVFVVETSARHAPGARQGAETAAAENAWLRGVWPKSSQSES